MAQHPETSTARRRLLGAGLLAVAALLLSSLAVPAPRAEAQAGGDGRVAGFGAYVNSGEIARLASAGGRAELDRMRRAGANTLLLDSMWQVPSRTSNRITTPSTLAQDDAVLARASEQARAAGLNVVLMPKIYCSGCGDDRWRGGLEPSDPEAFLVGSLDPNDPRYGAEGTYMWMSNHYADLATRIGAVTYFFGSEMVSLQRHTPAWQVIALEARQRYEQKPGGPPRKLAYQVNWTSMHIGFWDEVDIAGLSAYVPLTDAVAPNVADILDAWRSSTATVGPWGGTDWLAAIRRFQESTRSRNAPGGKPVLFGEMGYQSAPQAGQTPWVVNKFDGYDPQLQADLYQAALTLFGEQSWWLGALWWEWISTADAGDLGFSPRGKMAEELLTRWYRGERPPTRTTSLVGTTRPSSKGQPVPAGPPPDLDGRAAVTGGAPAPRAAAPAIRGTAPPLAPTGSAAAPAPPPSEAATVAPLPAETLASAAPDQALVLPELPPALAAVEAGTVEDALRRAAYRADLRRATTGATALLLLVALCHAAALTPRATALVRRRLRRT